LGESKQNAGAILAAAGSPEGLVDFAAAMRNLHKFGLYQYSTFNQADILTASGVGGGSLIYSNVSIRSEQSARDRIGLKISDADYDAARLWMEGPHGDRKNANRGWLNYVVTKIPMGKDMTAADFVSLGVDSTKPPLQQDTDEALSAFGPQPGTAHGGEAGLQEFEYSHEMGAPRAVFNRL